MSEIDWKEVGAIVGLLSVISTLLIALFLPSIRHFVRWLLREELADLKSTIKAVEGHADSLTFIRAAIEQQGAMLREWPVITRTLSEIPRVMEQQTDTLRALENDFNAVARRVRFHEGLLTERPWDGETERRKPRGEEP